MPRDKDGDYEVGYGKRGGAPTAAFIRATANPRRAANRRRPGRWRRQPPRHTRFRKGQSGNPRGRPSGSKNAMTVVYETLAEPVIVAENGGRRKIGKL